MLAELVAAKHAAAAELLARSPQIGLVGVGVGTRLQHGRATGEPCVRLYVDHKRPLAELAQDAVLPAAVGGFRTDVVETGSFSAGPARNVTPARTRQRVRPVRPGCSVGYAAPMAGTIGAVVRDRAGELHLLSCNHVLADENALSEGAPIYQPAVLDEGTRGDEVAVLSRFVRLQERNRVDGALAKAHNRYNVDGSILPHARLLRLPHTRAEAGQRVHKSGRSTGHTRGVVMDASVDLKVFYRAGILRFEEQILIEGAGFSQPGDSGALIVEARTHRPVGLLFAGSPSHTVANPIGEVLAALDVEIVA